MFVSELLQLFDNTYMQGRLKPSTIRGYRFNFNHINKYLGCTDISALTYAHIDTLVSNLRVEGLNNTTIRYVLAVLRKALNYGCKRGYIEKNILTSYDVPKPAMFFYNVLDEYQLNKLCNYLIADDIYPCVLLAGFYGMRKGEILGLRFSDFYYDEKDKQYIITVKRTVFDSHGRRDITSVKNDYSCRKLLISKEHSQNLKVYIQKRSHLFKGNFFVCNKVGEIVTTNQLSYRFKRALEFLKLPIIRFHDLRHSYATFMLRAGVHPKIVSSVLGHSDIGTTLDIYSHTDLSMQKACTDIIDDITTKKAE